jgi:hypothetical protein
MITGPEESPEIMMGDLIEGPSSADGLAATLVGVGEVALLDRLDKAAARFALTPDGFARLAVRRFCERAEEEDWLQVMSAVARTDRPGDRALSVILGRAVKDAEEAGE